MQRCLQLVVTSSLLFSSRKVITKSAEVSTVDRRFRTMSTASAPLDTNSSELRAFRADLAKAKRILVLTGAGVSAESGVPTFRGPDGFWGKYDVTQLATLDAFKRNPGLVWMFYAYRRQLADKIRPNAAHEAIAELERNWKLNGRHVVVVTQNIDGLHQRAGSSDVVELHGSLFRTQCMKCGVVEENTHIPICEALRDAKIPETYEEIHIKLEELPHCKLCKYTRDTGTRPLLRPAIVWFGENLDAAVMQRAALECDACDLSLIVGTSSLVQPASLFAPHIAQRGVPVAEFNLEKTAMSFFFKYHFAGPAGQTLPVALKLPINHAEISEATVSF